MKHLNDMKKVLMLLVMLCISLFAPAQETAEPSYNARFAKEVISAYINSKHYTNVSVEIYSSSSHPTDFWGLPEYPYVKIKIYDSDNKKIYSKKLKRSKLYIFDTGKNIQIGQANMTTEAILKKTDYGWTLDFDEKGDL